MPAVPTLTKVVDYTEDGREVTVHDRLIGAMRSGLSIRRSSELAGVDDSHVHAWIRQGAKLARSDKDHLSMTAGERAALAFSDAANEAIAVHQLRIVDALHQLAVGGTRVESTKVVEVVERVETEGGQIVERVVERRTERSTKVLAPNATALIFLLEARYPDDWSRRSRLELTGADGSALLPEQGAVDGLLGELERMGERLARSNALLSAVDDPETTSGG